VKTGWQQQNVSVSNLLAIEFYLKLGGTKKENQRFFWPV